MSKVKQRSVIYNLNKYLEWNNLPARLNTYGICLGLCTVHDQYFLEGRQEEFWKMLDYVAGKPFDSEMETSVNDFVFKIVVSQFPEQFDKSMRQRDASHVLNHNAASVFHMVLTTETNNWVKIIEELDLSDDEILVVENENHAMRVTKKGAKYVLYDPNHGHTEFDNAETLIRFMHTETAKYESDLLALNMQICTKKSDNLRQKHRPLPDDFYARYVTPHNVDRMAVQLDDMYSDGRLAMDMLTLAVRVNNDELVAKLIDIGAKNISTALSVAVTTNAPKSLNILLNSDKVEIPSAINDQPTSFYLFFQSLETGSEQSYDLVTTHPKYSQEIKLYNMPVFATQKLQAAAQGGNPRLLTRIIDTLDMEPRQLANIILEKNIFGVDAIQTAIKSGSSESVRLLFQTLESAQYELSEERKLSYLTAMVQSTEPNLLLVDYLLTTLTVEKENILPILKLALENGREDVFDTLLLNDLPYSAVIKDHISQPEAIISCIHSASKSNNIHLLQKLVSKIALTDKLIFELYRKAKVESWSSAEKSMIFDVLKNKKDFSVEEKQFALQHKILLYIDSIMNIVYKQMKKFSDFCRDCLYRRVENKEERQHKEEEHIDNAKRSTP